MAPTPPPATSAVPAEDPRGVAERLHDRPFPELPLSPFSRPLAAQLCLGGHIIYTYHGLPRCLDSDSATIDAAQHLAFRDLSHEWEEREIAVIGVSSGSESDRTKSILVNQLEHELVSDSSMLLADALALPTFTCEGQRCYERLVLLATPVGRIAHVFYPLAIPGRAAIQALTWMRLYGSPSPPTPEQRA